MTNRRYRAGSVRRGMRGIACGAVGLIAAIVWVTPLAAATASTTIAVSATVAATCRVTVTPLAFGTYASVQNDATATATVTCTNTTPFTLGINTGLNSGSNYQWNLAGPGASLLAYRLYRDAARTVFWGSVGGDTSTGTGNGAAQTITFYGREPAAQFVQPGAYSDTVTLTLSY